MEIIFHIYEIAHPLIYVKNDIMTNIRSEFLGTRWSYTEEDGIIREERSPYPAGYPTLSGGIPPYPAGYPTLCGGIPPYPTG